MFRHTNQYPYGDLGSLNLDWLISTVQQLEVDITGLRSEVSGYLNAANAYTDQKNIEVLKKVDGKLAALEVSLNKQYNEFIVKINANIVDLQASFDQLRRETSAAITGANAYTDTRIDQNNDYIFEKIGDEILDVKVLNYFTGELVTIQEMFDYLAAFHLSNAIDMTTLAARNKTVTQMVALKATCTDLATNGASIIK